MHITIVEKDSNSSVVRILPNPNDLLPESRRDIPAQSLLAQIRESRQELRCHCCTPPARMFVRYSHDTFTLVNHASEGQHEDHCPLVTEVHGYGDRNQNGSGGGHEDASLDNFYIHRNVTEGDQPRTSHSHSASTNPVKRESKLDKLYRFICEKTLSNWYFKKKFHSKNYMLGRFRDECASIEFGDTSLNEWCFFGDRGYEFACNKLRYTIKKRLWNGRGRPHAFVFFLCEKLQIGKDKIVIDGQSYSIRNSIRPYAQAGAPFFVILTVCVEPDASIISHTAYIRPVALCDMPFPVDSQLERGVALSLFEAIDKSESRWSVNKPVFSRAIYATTPSVLPDFVVQRKNAQGKMEFKAVIEVMGMTDSEYHRRKDRLVPIMIEAWNASEVIKVYPDHDLEFIRELFG
ncbi:hypothetical protein [Vibrio anguillarum]|nr:hypothetical protein [Vibrio anguillarum]